MAARHIAFTYALVLLLAALLLASMPRAVAIGGPCGLTLVGVSSSLFTKNVGWRTAAIANLRNDIARGAPIPVHQLHPALQRSVQLLRE